MGDAAHPVSTRVNGAAQALIDARVLADELAKGGGHGRALAYEGAPRGHGEDRAHQPPVPPDYIIMKVEELTGGKPFGNIDDVISQAELRELSDNYKRIAGFALEKRA
jgi:hypothetical protein